MNVESYDSTNVAMVKNKFTKSLIPLNRYYTYGNENLLRQELIDEVNMLADLVDKTALTTSHPNYKLWLTRFNLLSEKEVQFVKSPKI
jgi:hypothetical protein